MKIFLITFILAIVSTSCFAQQQEAYLKGGNILLKDSQGNLKVLDHQAKNKIWKVTDQQGSSLAAPSDPVQEALNVYKKRSLDGEKAWIIDQANGTKTLIVGTEYSGAENALVFSPDGSRAFYVDMDASGSHVLYGYDLSTSQRYSFGGATSFGLADCPNTNNYVVIHRDGDAEGYYSIYDLEGNSIDTINYSGDINDIRDVICY